MLVTLLPIVTLVRPCRKRTRPIPDGGDAVRDSDAGQAGAGRERESPMLVTLLPDGDAGQAAAARERIVADGGDAVWGS